MNMTDLMAAVKLLGQGMAGILVVMAAIALVVYLITKFSGKKK
ncbi:MAG: hypothetical protein UHS49_05295 [Faecalimonas sp.]|nr:hypothetical protein [Faecalimonas sp.]